MTRPWPVHPVCFALAPLLALYARNAHQLTPGVLVWPALVLMGATLLVWTVAGFALHSARRGAVAEAVAACAFLYYGHARNVLEPVRAQALGLDVSLGDDWLLVPLWLAMFTAIGWALARRRASIEAWTRVLNLAGAVLLAVPLVQLVAYAFDGDSAPEAQAPSAPAAVRASANAPDIYYLVLDGYGRADVLATYFGFDNTPFLEGLEARGFNVAEASVANYPSTLLSLGSTLNMRYLPAPYPRARARKLLEDNRLLALVRAHGYRYMHWGSSAAYTASNPRADLNVQRMGAQEFVYVLARSSLLACAQETTLSLLRRAHREHILSAFDRLPELRTRFDGPVCVFAHLILPHPPYLFAASGEPRAGAVLRLDQTDWAPAAHYLDQVRFANRKVLDLVDRVVAASDRPVVLVIQGDHGPGTTFPAPHAADARVRYIRERMPILNALRLPDRDPDLVWPGITPVNTFRVVANAYLDADLKRLPDRAWFPRTLDKPEDGYEDVTELLRTAGAVRSTSEKDRTP